LGKRIVLIQCTDSKRNHAAEARKLYDESSYFCKMRRYAQLKGDSWYILSAKHGLVAPQETLEPYDVVGLSESQAEDIAKTIAEKEPTEVEIVAGKEYTNPLVPELEAYGIDVIDSFQGLRIGKRQQKLNEEIRRLENTSLC
jgi:hypothetical protein